MDIEYRFLNESYINEIYRTWMESFADYQVDMSYLTLEKMISRTRMDRVEYNFSVGAFYDNKTVGKRRQQKFDLTEGFSCRAIFRIHCAGGLVRSVFYGTPRRGGRRQNVLKQPDN